MYTTIDEFVKDWTAVAEGTQKMMNELTDASLSQAVADGHRTLGRLAWHIAITIPEMMNQLGLKVTSLDHKARVPKTAGEIKSAYAAISKELGEQVKAIWKDEDLQKEDEMYGQKWKRAVTAQILVRHEIHHRGQMTVLMRQAGLKVPGLFGPSKEEWAGMNMEDPEIQI